MSEITKTNISLSNITSGKPQLLRGTNELIALDCLLNQPNVSTWNYCKWIYRGWRPQGCRQNYNSSNYPLIESIELSKEAGAAGLNQGMNFGWKFSGSSLGLAVEMTRIVQDEIPIDMDKTYTFSYWAKCIPGTTGQYPSCRLEWWSRRESGSGTGATIGGGKTSEVLTNTWKRYTFTCKLEQKINETIYKVTSGNINAHFGTKDMHDGDIVYIAGCKLEEGSVATPWSEYPGDNNLTPLTPKRNWTRTYLTDDIVTCNWVNDLSRRPKLGETFQNLDGSSKTGTWEVVLSGNERINGITTSPAVGLVTTDNIVVIKSLANVNSKGADGADGHDGTSITITSRTISYVASTSGTVTPSSGWIDTVPTVPAGQFLWTKTVVNYSDSSNTTSYSVSYMGTNGNDGTSVLITSQSVTYQIHSSGTTAPTGAWLDNIPATTTSKPYLWTKTTVVYSNDVTTTSYAVAKQGIDGINGTSAEQVIAYYCTGKTMGKTAYSLPIADSTVSKSTGTLTMNSNNFATKDLYDFTNGKTYADFNTVESDVMELKFSWSASNAPAGATVKVGTNADPWEYFGVCLTLSAGSSSGSNTTITKTLTNNNLVTNGKNATTVRFRFDNASGLNFTVTNISITRKANGDINSPSGAPVSGTASVSARDVWYNAYNSNNAVNGTYRYMYRCLGTKVGTSYSWQQPELFMIYDNGVKTLSDPTQRYFYGLIKDPASNQGTIAYDSAGKLYINATAINTGILRVGGTGQSNALLYADIGSGTLQLAGWNVDNNSISTGTIGSNGSAKLSKTNFSGTYAGQSSSISDWRFTIGSKFGVTSDGILYASGGNFSGTINASGGKISGDLDLSGYLTNTTSANNMNIKFALGTFTNDWETGLQLIQGTTQKIRGIKSTFTYVSGGSWNWKDWIGITDSGHFTISELVGYGSDTANEFTISTGGIPANNEQWMTIGARRYSNNTVQDRATLTFDIDTKNPNNVTSATASGKWNFVDWTYFYTGIITSGSDPIPIKGNWQRSGETLWEGNSGTGKTLTRTVTTSSFTNFDYFVVHLTNTAISIWCTRNGDIIRGIGVNGSYLYTVEFTSVGANSIYFNKGYVKEANANWNLNPGFTINWIKGVF